MSDCTLCNLYADGGADSLRIGCNDAALAVLHEDWAVPGHTMVVARDHVENTSELSSAAAASFLDLFMRTEAALIQALGVERVILLKLGLAVPHLHWHLYPVSRTVSRSEIFEAFAVRGSLVPGMAKRLLLVEQLRAALGTATA